MMPRNLLGIEDLERLLETTELVPGGGRLIVSDGV